MATLTPNQVLDQKANELRAEWFRYVRKPLVPWDELSERIQQSWRFLAGAGYFPEGMETGGQKRFYKRRVPRGERVQNDLVPNPQLRDDVRLGSSVGRSEVFLD